jgi:hypothetical protein
MVPSNANKTWCLYCFDRRTRKVYVIDPMLRYIARTDKRRYYKNHESIITQLRSGFRLISTELFANWDYDYGTMHIDYIDLRDQYCEVYV